MDASSEESLFDLPPRALDFIEKISLHYENVYNLPRIGARILGLLLLVPGPVQMDAMERILKVSHGSVSTNLRLLIVLNYVERITYPGDRCNYYRFLPRSRVRVLQERINHYRDLKKVIHEAQQELELKENASRSLEEMLAWAELAIAKNSQFIQEWDTYLHSGNKPPSGE